MLRQLVRIHQATHTILDPEYVIVHRVNGILKARRLTNNASRVEAGEVEGTSGLHPGGVKAERERVQRSVHLSVRGVEVRRRRRVVGIDEFEISDIGTVDLELDTVGRRVDAIRDDITRGEELDGVVEVEFLGTPEGRQGLLNLCNQDGTGFPGEQFTFICVQVDIVGVALHTADGTVHIGMRLPSDAKLNIVILESHEGESRLPVLTERESERVEFSGSGTVIETTGNRFGETGREEVGGDLVGEESIMVINHLTSHKKLDLVDHGRPVKGLTGVGGVVDRREVRVPDEITLTFEANSGHTTCGESTLDHLTFHSLGKVCVTPVGRTKETHLGITDEVGILGSDGNKLGNTTRHFILYGDFIFKLWDNQFHHSGTTNFRNSVQFVKFVKKQVRSTRFTTSTMSGKCTQRGPLCGHQHP